MNTLTPTPQRRRGAFRRFIATQNRLWDQYHASLRPWEQEAELHWVRNVVTRRWELRGGVLPPSA
ncbi:hypothetical protein A8924_4599 [Saccharopolyspora erythraea NRRL 2338]|uniref:Uncharacterized protein n=2 Tax=Saccharopolyspora erythraea TaxID=1836 RepID=A4FHF2_SACEN|nr:hypothetical protein [Saccharopolyspora erythraea]PFG97172.1 hypothetical protein A8924_4599 [Saccharopolyspora erythraea NRRL 2338]QRK87374.1 hypothetical protein JQX30_21455 [Saccharopolyspora erythraea]CAM03477.1 hypothetical protein SACE_4208 [Saccharopolyspora erythraea NRRL 2338]